jgi:hypothetical protein
MPALKLDTGAELSALEGYATVRVDVVVVTGLFSNRKWRHKRRHYTTIDKRGRAPISAQLIVYISEVGVTQFEHFFLTPDPAARASR